MKLGLIVEGQGEVAALPVLLRRLAAERVGLALDIPAPLRMPKGKMRKPDELSRAVELVARKTAPNGGIIILVDADDDCPVALATELMGCVTATRGERIASVVVATREFESWFVAGISGLRGYRGLPETQQAETDAELLRDAKGWLDVRMSNGYHETTDQPKLAQLFDMKAAMTSRSFRKLRKDFDRLVTLDCEPESTLQDV